MTQHQKKDEKTVYQKRVAELRRKLADRSGMHSYAAWIIQPENRRYLSGFKAEDTQINESSGSLLINENRCLVITDPRYGLEAKKDTVDFEVHVLKGDFADGFSDLIVKTGNHVLGFEEEYVTFSLYRKLTEKLESLPSPVILEAMDGVVESMREVKDEFEINAMKKSAELMSEVLDEIIPKVEPGVTEREIAWRIESTARDKGADGMAFPPIVASGPNSALPHAVPSDRKLKAGEPIIIDVGARLEGYCSDMTRTLFLGEPDSEFRIIYHTVRQAQLEALKAIKPGVESNAPDKIARDFIAHAGFGDYFIHSLGHGVGLATHEGPRLGPLKPVILEKGMVVTVEPGIYIPEKGGVRLEEMVVLEEDGPRVLTRNNHFYDFS